MIVESQEVSAKGRIRPSIKVVALKLMRLGPSTWDPKMFALFFFWFSVLLVVSLSIGAREL